MQNLCKYLMGFVLVTDINFHLLSPQVFKFIDFSFSFLCAFWCFVLGFFGNKSIEPHDPLGNILPACSC